MDLSRFLMRLFALIRANFANILRFAIVIASIAVLFWLQPTSAVRNVQWLLPSLALLLTLVVWLATQHSSNTKLHYTHIALIVVMFVALKTEPLAQSLSAGLRQLQGQNPANAVAGDMSWLGFSYIAFRLIHVLRDKVSGRLPKVNVIEFVGYVLFAPALIAGPIDRVERFIKDWRMVGLQSRITWLELVSVGCERLLIGAFKKFALADTLALIALNDHNALQTNTIAGTWLLAYAYAFRLFFDFSGYTDMAIGAGRLIGIQLPENFGNPYLKPNLTVFWNHWHITLSQWFRAYWFTPFSRWLRQFSLPTPLMIFLSQASTMLLIALWHGVSPNFVAWGVWHALGLFLHNRWVDLCKRRNWVLTGRTQQMATVAGVVLTFHYVVLGWVWFALSSPALSVQVLAKLVGF
jgi:D-alanyl-lipoteichoic acid acyltransferase DltB (MBOAT superfamily)